MKKHNMKFKAKRLVFKRVRGGLEIVEQTHRNEEFGQNSANWTASNGVRLNSCRQPALGSGSHVWCRGLDGSQDSAKIFCNSRQARRIIAAAKEYTRRFSKPIKAALKHGVFELVNQSVDLYARRGALKLRIGCSAGVCEFLGLSFGARDSVRVKLTLIG